MYKSVPSDAWPQKEARVCSSCGCACEGCLKSSTSLDLQQRIEELQSQLLRSHAHMSNLNHEYENSKQTRDFEMLKLREELVKLRDRYERLLESYKRMQKINDSLENKILKVVNSYEGEKTALQKELATLTSKLVDAKSAIYDLEEDNERYRNDCNIAVQLLQCKPSNFVAQKLCDLPVPLQERVKCHMTTEEVINTDNNQGKETTKLIQVPMQTFPPTAMVYSVPKVDKNEENKKKNKENENVPVTLIAKVLSQPELKRTPQRVFVCVKCLEDYSFSHKQTQTTSTKDSDRGNDHVQTVSVHRKIRSQSSSSSTETEI